MPCLEAIAQKRDVANIRTAASSCNNLAKYWPLLKQTIALSAAEIPRFGVLASIVGPRTHEMTRSDGRRRGWFRRASHQGQTP